MATIGFMTSLVPPYPPVDPRVRLEARDGVLRHMAVAVWQLRASVDSAARGPVEHGHLDVLLNNAGRGAVGTAEQQSMDVVRAQLEVTYLGPVGMTTLVVPFMREHGSGRHGDQRWRGRRSALSRTPTAGRSSPWRGSRSRWRLWPSPTGSACRLVEPAAVASELVANVARLEVGDDAYAPQLSAYLDRRSAAFATALVTGCGTGDRRGRDRRGEPLPVADQRAGLGIRRRLACRPGRDAGPRRESGVDRGHRVPDRSPDRQRERVSLTSRRTASFSMRERLGGVRLDHACGPYSSQSAHTGHPRPAGRTLRPSIGIVLASGRASGCGLPPGGGPALEPRTFTIRVRPFAAAVGARLHLMARQRSVVGSPGCR